MGPMPFNLDPQRLLQEALQRNPQLQQNPQAQQYIQVLMSGDVQRGQELAQNICQTMGVSPDQGVQTAQQFFQQMQQQMMGGRPMR